MLGIVASLAVLALGLGPASAVPIVRKFNASSFMVTMYSRDPQSNTIDLLSAMSGSSVSGFTQFNSNSDISYGPYKAGYLASGIQGGDRAVFVDLGTSDSLVGKDHCETVPGGQYFSSLHVAQGQVVVVDTCGSSNACPQTFRNISGLSQKLDRLQSLATIAPVPGHIYILRIGNGASTRAMFKILVLDVGQANTSVTFRYSVLDFKQKGIVQCCNEQNENICAPAPRNLVVEQGPTGTRGPASAAVIPSPSPGVAPAPQGAAVTGGEVAGAAVASVAVSLVAMGGVWWCVGRRGADSEETKRRLISEA